MSYGLILEADPLDPRLWAPDVIPERRIWPTNYDTVSALVDEDVYQELARYSWNAFTTRAQKVYFRRSKNLTIRRGVYTNVTILLHRDIMRIKGVEPPTPEHRVVDHVDGNEYDCRFQNLRWATYLTNRTNRK